MTEVSHYLVERTFPQSLQLDSVTEERCRQIIERNGGEVLWLRSYVSEDGRKWFCTYEAPSPEAIRKSADRNDLPVDRITSVRVLDLYPYTNR